MITTTKYRSHLSAFDLVQNLQIDRVVRLQLIAQEVGRDQVFPNTMMDAFIENQRDDKIARDRFKEKRGGEHK